MGEVKNSTGNIASNVHDAMAVASAVPLSQVPDIESPPEPTANVVAQQATNCSFSEEMTSDPFEGNDMTTGDGELQGQNEHAAEKNYKKDTTRGLCCYICCCLSVNIGIPILSGLIMGFYNEWVGLALLLCYMGVFLCVMCSIIVSTGGGGGSGGGGGGGGGFGGYCGDGGGGGVGGCGGDGG